MKFTLARLSVLTVAVASIATQAEAGGGVRLGFGGPLPSFVATPAGGGGGYASRPSKPARSVASRKARSLHAARTPAQTAQPKAKPAKRAAPAPVESTTGNRSEPANEPAAKTGSTALIEQSTPIATDPVAADPPTPADPPADEGQPETSATATGDTADASGSEKLNCKKFVPAVGTIVTVGCKD